MTTSIVVGASSGIGRSLACALGRELRHVVLIGRRADALERVAYEVTAFGGSATAVVSDTRDPQSIADAIKIILVANNRIDMVFLSQGIGRKIPDMERFDAATVRDALETNVLGVANWLEALQPILSAQHEGSTAASPSFRGESVVAVLSSLAAGASLPGSAAAYSASKAAVSHLCDGLRAAWRRQGIHLVTVEPGFVRTPMTDGQTFMPLLMEPEDAARIILDGIRRGDRVIRFPKLAALTMVTLGLIPARWLDALYRPTTKGEIS